MQKLMRLSNVDELHSANFRKANGPMNGDIPTMMGSLTSEEIFTLDDIMSNPM